MTELPTSDRRRRLTIAGVTAGLLGGGAAGLLLTAPTLAGASGAAPVAVVSLQDDTGTDDSTTDDSTTDARPEPGARVREALQDLVDDGTITAEQADAVAEHLAATRPERGPGGRGGMGDMGGPGGHGPGHGRGVALEAVAEAIGIDVATLGDELRSGSTIAEVAEANGVDVQVVIDAMVAEASEHLDQAVADGRLTEDEAAAKLAEITERITARVQDAGPAGAPEGRRAADD